MTQLLAGTDFVQLPVDAAGKKTGFLLATVSGGTLYLPAAVLTDTAGNVLTAAKGTQSASGVATQDLKDSGRSAITLAWEEMTGTAAAESTLTNFTFGQKAGAAITAATSYTVTSGKTFRITSITIYIKATSTVINLGRFRIRQAASAIANTSQVIFDAVLSHDVATVAANTTTALSIPIPDGLELASTQQLTFTWFTSANTCTVGMTILGFEY